MFLRLLFILTLIPFLEIYFLIRLSDSIGWSKTFIIIFLTGFIGAWLLRKQGHNILMQVQQSATQNQVPSDAITKGFFTFVGGLLLLTPGIITDILGLTLIFPLTQILWKKYFLNQIKTGVATGKVRVYSNFGQNQNPFEPPFQRQQESRQTLQNDVIDIKANQSQTIDKKPEE